MSRASYIVLAIFVLVASAVVVGWSFFGWGTPKPQPASPSTNQSSSPVPESSSDDTIIQPDGTIVLPVNIEDPVVVSAALSYRFYGIVQEVRKSGEGLELITDIQVPGLPRFIVTPQTRVFSNTVANLQMVRGSAANLKPGQRVSINTEYDLKRKQWNVITVAATDANVSVSSPSATPSVKTR